MKQRIIYITCLLLFLWQAGNTQTLTGTASFCAGKVQTFTLEITNGTGANELEKTVWDFGDESDLLVVPLSAGVQTHKQTHTYKKRGAYTITVKCYLKSNGSEVTAQRKTLRVKVNSCRLPVNHNTSLMGAIYEKESGVDSEASLSPVAFGDPFVLLHENTYYAYGTGGANSSSNIIKAVISGGS